VNAEAEALNVRDRQAVLAAGKVKVIALSNAEREAWRQAMLPVWKRYEDEIGADVIRAALAVNRKR
jgi:C4-dicarboxylate-binding protein DctP